MKNKKRSRLTFPIMVLSAIVLAGCKADISKIFTSNKNSQENTQESKDSSNEENLDGNSSEGGSNNGSSSGGNGSSGGNSGGNTSGGGGSSSEGGEDIDLNGYEAIATCEDATSLSDWPEDMKTILATYLRGVIPPFIGMTNMQVTHDNLGITQARGDSREGIIEEYAAKLENAGYAYYTQADNGGKMHIYGRLLNLSAGYLLELDGLDSGKIFSINFDYYPLSSSWPSDELASITYYEYESREVIPQLDYPNAQYYFEYDYMYNIFINCFGASELMLSYYQSVLEENNWEVVLGTGEYEGYYFARSRDHLIKLVYYFDGTGIQIQATHGEGEVYTTWEDCKYALNDFGRKELRLTSDVADSIPEINVGDETVRYTIDRETSHRGVLKIVLHRDRSFSNDDVANYWFDCRVELGFQGVAKNEVYWLYPEDHSYAFYITTQDYISDLGETWDDIVIALCDYRIFEGYYVYYGEWPEAVVNTVARNISSKLKFPVISSSTSTYYVYSNHSNQIKMDILGLDSDVIEQYKEVIRDEYEWSVKSIPDGFEAIDPDELAKISVSMKDNGELHWELGKYVNSTLSDGVAKFNFSNANQLVENAQDWRYAIWECGGVSFKVEKNTASETVGNYGLLIGKVDSIENKFYPLAVFAGQKITITAPEGQLISKLVFYAYNEGSYTYNKRDMTLANLANLEMVGATVSTNESLASVTYTLGTAVNSITISVPNHIALDKLNVFIS